MTKEIQPTNYSESTSAFSQDRRDLLELLLQQKGNEFNSFPLSFAQQRLWFLDQMEGESTIYNVPLARRIKGQLNIRALERSLSEIIRRHEVLRTRFGVVGGEPVQVIAEPEELQLAVTDLSELSEPEREERAEELAKAEGQGPFDLASGPLLRASLLRLGEAEHVLLITMHHIISDGWSMGVFFRELGALYEAYQAERESPLAELAVQYADYAVWQREYLGGAVLEEQLGYWKEQLGGAPAVLELPTDQPRPSLQSYQGAIARFRLRKEVSEAIKELSQREGVTLFMTLLAAFQVLLGRYSGQSEVVVGTPIAGRNRVEVEPLIGLFVNTLALRTDLSGNPSFRELLQRVREVCLGAYGHQDVPFEKLVEELQPERSLSHAPIFQVMFQLQNTPRELLALENLSLSRFRKDGTTAKFDITVAMLETELGLVGSFEYNSDLFEESTIKRMMGHFENLLEAIVAAPDEAVTKLSLLGGAEREQLLQEWNETGTEYRAGCVHELFAEQVRRTPGAIALVSEEQQLSYQELEERANQVAGLLRERGLGGEALVGIVMERSVEMVVALLGVLKAGAAYVPLDPQYPEERLRYMIEDSGVRVVLTQEKLAAQVREYVAGGEVAVWALDGRESELSSGPAGPSRAAVSSSVGGENLAYVIYTSGSTGRPKAAMNTHGAIANRLQWMQEAYGLTAEDRVLQKTPFSFDVSVWEFFWPLITGARLVMARPGGHQDSGYLVGLMRAQQITTLHFVPSMLRVFLEQRELAGCGSVRQVICSGEELSWELQEQFFRRLGWSQLHNLYGPTEAAVDVSYWDCRQAASVAGVVPIGRPIANTQLYVLDEQLEPVAVGLAGELYIGGRGVGRGYLRRPETTAARFIPDPFSVAGGQRLYRTGDRVRWLVDGSIEFLGRLDHQVKMRGHRIELGEIESVLREQAGVSEAVVVVQGEREEERRLVAYVVSGNGPEVGSRELREQLRQRLPEYLVPAVIVALAELPLTANGKIDRRALPEPEGSAGRSVESERERPETAVEELLCGIWSEVLRVKEVGIRENFFELGGHSLLATRVISRIREVFGVELPLRSVFEGPTVAELSERVAAATAAPGEQSAPAISAVSRAGALPLSFAQQRLWFLEQMEGESTIYNVPLARRIKGQLNIRALERSLSEIIRRHEVLRTRFGVVGGEPVQVIAEPEELQLAVTDLSELSEPEREERAEELAKAEGQGPFDLASGPLLRASLLRLGEAEHVLLITMHHIISDGWSMGVFFRELGALYEAYQAERESPLAELAVQYADYAVWQREYLRGAVLEEQLGYWKEQLGGAPAVLELPTDRARPAVQSYRGATASFQLPAAVSAGLRELSQREGVTLFMTLLAAFQVLLGRYSGQSEVVVGTPIAGRNRAAVEPLIGLFVNTLALRTDLSGNPSFRELLQRVREVCLGAYGHQDVPFEKLVEELQPERSLSHAPIFQVIFQLQNRPRNTKAAENLRMQEFKGASEVSVFDLQLGVAETIDGLTCSLMYKTALFDAEKIQRLIGHFMVVLENIAADPSQRIAELPLSSEEERERILVQWNDTRTGNKAGRCIHELFEEQVERTPDQIAVVLEGKPLSYRKLNARANQLANYLRTLGVGPEVLVGICVERSVEMIVGLLGILKAGGAYLPLDPHYPQERLAYMMKDVRLQLLLTQKHLLAGFSGHKIKTLCLDTQWKLISRASEQNPRSLANGEHLAYVLYTSGSTGQPRGVMIAHQSLANRMVSLINKYGLDTSHRMLQFLSPSFDAFAGEIYPTLASGGTLVLHRNPAALSPPEFFQTCKYLGVTTFHAPPVFWQQLTEELALSQTPVPAWLKLFITGGDSCSLESIAAWSRLTQHPSRFINAYGPTEATVTATLYELPIGPEAKSIPAKLPIGRPLDDTEIYLLDENLQPTPVGVPGELCIGGLGVARGYYGRPQLTAEKFVPNCFSAEPGARIYRTGDIACYLPDGNIEFIGRLDDQVKIRGFRIELGEIEAALRTHQSAAQSAVVVREDVPGDKRLVAYVVPQQKSTAFQNVHLHRLPNELEVAHLNRNETELLYEEIFRDQIYLRNGITIADGDCVFDVGANIGMFTLFVNYARRNLRVFAFEPIPDTFEALRTNVSLYGLNVHSYQCGVSSRSGTAEFTYYPRSTASSGMYADPKQDEQVTRAFIKNQQEFSEHAEELLAGRFEALHFTCQLRTISEIINEHKLEQIDLLKVDVEKSECDVLEGIQDEDWLKIKQLVVEVHDVGGRLDQILNLLDKHDFEFKVEQNEVMKNTGLYNVYAVHPTRAKPVANVSANGSFRGPLAGGIAGLSASSLRRFLEERLPEYMVPSAFVILDSLPLTPSGKVDRRALPAPEQSRPELARAYETPRTPVQEILCSLWANTLHVKQVGIRDNFFELGGHSLLATRVISRIREVFGVELPLRSVFEGPTVAELSERVAAATAAPGEQSAPAISAVSRAGALPLSFAQQRLWFLEQMEGESTIYNVPLARRIKGQLNIRALERSLSEIIRRHEVLRTRFGVVGGEPVQVIAEPEELQLAVTDLSELSEPEREERAEELAKAEGQGPFDLASGPLLRASLLRLGEAEHVLLITMHHIISDGWSMGVFFRELGALYEAYQAERESPLAELAVQYADYAVWQREYLRGAVLEEQLGYWKEQLGGAPAVLELPTDRARPAVQSYRGATASFQLPAAVSAGLRELSQREGVTLFMTLLAAFQVLLGRYSGQSEVVVGTPIAGRNRAAVEPLIGLFVNTLALRTDLSGNPSFRELLQRVREVCLGAYGHQDVPFEKLVEELQPERSLSHAPIFQVMFQLQNQNGTEAVPGGLEWGGSVGQAGETAKFDLLLVMSEREGVLQGTFEYATELFERETMAEWAGHWEQLLGAVSANAEERVRRLPLLGEGAVEQLLLGPNRRGVEIGSQSVVELIAQQAAERGGEVAVQCEGQSLSYEELNEAANRVAHGLREAGVGAETVVGLLQERGVEYLVSLLGVLKAGAAFLPLEREYPEERLREMLQQSGCRVVVAGAGELEQGAQLAAGWGAEQLPVYSYEELTREELGSSNPSWELAPRSLAYVIFTSGSTGRPKGVMIEQEGLLNHLWAKVRDLGLGAGEVVAQVARQTFDVSIWQYLAALLVGGRVVVLRGAEAWHSVALLRQLAEQGVTVIETVPSHMQMLLEELESGVEQYQLEQLRLFIVNGEGLRVELCRRWQAVLGRVPVVNMYGVTECADDVSHHWVREAPEQESGYVGIDGTLENMKLYVLDEEQGVAPVGVVGEVYIGGVGVGRGYVGAAARTAAVFVPDQWSEQGGERLYRTGDLARYVRGGGIEYVGRRDEQVKVRGHRIELGEIESVLREQAGVSEAVVVVQGEREEERRLVAYVVSGNGPEVGSRELREQLRQRLPEYLVPAVIVALAELPLTANGKIDRRALPEPEGNEGRSVESRWEGPRTAVEELLCGIWANTLHLKQVGIRDNFFELGGHSLLATRVISRIREVFGVELPLRSVFEGPTVAELSERVAAATAAPGEQSVPAISAVSRAGALPLSFAQQRLWFLDQMEPGKSIYNMPMANRLKGALDIRALERSLSEIIRRHEVLRSSFAVIEGQPTSVIAAAQPLSLEIIDFSALTDEEREQQAIAHANAEAQCPFNLSESPLIRAKLLRLGAEEHVLLITMHHIIGDGWSLSVFFRELGALYEAYQAERESPLAELAVQYADYAVWQREYLRGAVLEEQLGYWKEQLGGAPAVLELPTDRARPAVQSYRGATASFQLPAAVSAGLRELSQREGVTLFMTLLAAFQVLLGRYSGQSEVVVGTPIAGRNRAAVEPLIGLFVNTLALRTDLSGNPSFRELLQRVREVCLGAYGHQDVPFEKLVEELQPERSLSHAPLFQTTFQLQNAGQQKVTLGGLNWGGFKHQGKTAKFDLTMLLADTEEGLKGAVEYATDLFEEATIRRLLEQFSTLLEGIVAAPEEAVGRLPLLRGRERERLLTEWNQTGREYPAGASIEQLFEEQARRRPTAIAVECGGEQLSYQELNERANQLGRLLRERGVGAETVVGLCLERSVEMIVSLLGILKAGGVYLALDESYPEERLRYMLGAADARLLLTKRKQAEGLGGVAEGLPVLLVDEEWEQVLEQAGSNLELASLGGEQLCYLNYTSGSTGQPKGVSIRHRGVVRLVRSGGYVEFGEQEVFLQQAPLNFDASTFEIWGALLNGGRLVVMPPGVASLAELGAAVREHEVTTLWLTAGLFHQMVEMQLAELGGVKQLVAGGDVLSRQHVERYLESCVGGSGRRLVNGYGPTENTTFSCCAVLNGNEEPEARVSIGVPIANTEVYLLDEQLEPVPEGVAGELYLGGDGLARGYAGAAGLTAASFIPHPFSRQGGQRLYRTGDQGRRLSDGRIDFLGRLDHQVKMRGHRIELGEIESVLREQAGVSEAVVVVQGEREEERRLVAYVVSGNGPAVGSRELREQLRQRLPEYLVPAVIVALAELPLTANGKIDRRALPEPEGNAGSSVESERERPETAVEELLCGIWSEVLRVKEVGIRENFFELGGHSLLATRVISRIREVFGVELPLRSVFEGPTVAELSERVAAATAAPGEQSVPAISAVSRAGALPLSFAQQRLWFLDQMEPGKSIYNMPMANRLKGALDIRALERSLSEIIRRHEVLRTRFGVVGGEPVQVIAEPEELQLAVTDLSELSEPEREERAEELAKAEGQGPFDLASGPLLRASLLRLGEAEHVLLITMHHIISDGWSMGVFFRELGALYEAYQAERESPLAELAVQYADYAVWQREYLRGAVLEEQLGYWKEQLGGAPAVLELPTDRARPAVQSYRGATASFQLPAAVSAGLRELSQREGVTLFMTLLAAFQVLLGRYSGQSEVVVGTPIAGRNRAAVEPLIGLFVNTLALRTDLSGNPSFRELLQRVREVCLGAYGHQDVPFEKLVEELQPERSLSHAPIFQVMFQLQNQNGTEAVPGGLEWGGSVGQAGETAKFDLLLVMSEREGVLQGTFEYATELFERETMAEWAGHWEQLLGAVSANAEERVRRLPLLGEGAVEQLLLGPNRRGVEIGSQSVVELIAQQAAERGGEVAVQCEGQSLSYEELNEAANRVAHGLREAGVGAETVVGLLQERGVEYLVSLLGVLKAGAAFLPLEREYPEERLREMLQQSGCRVVVAGAGELEQGAQLAAGWGAEQLPVYSYEELTREELGSSNPSWELAPRSLAYVIFTSGSTGRPKGVMIEQEGLLNHLWAKVRDLGLGAGEVVAQVARQTFDVSIWQYLAALLVGGRVVVLRGAEAWHSVALLRQLAEQGVTVIETVPSHMQMLLEELESGVEQYQLEQLRLFIVNGEGLRVELCRRWQAVLGRVPVVNMYGVTECADDVSHHWVREAPEQESGYVGIDGTLENMKLYVLDEEQGVAPVGVVGEVYIGGVGVGRGYVGAAARTAAVFVPDQWSEQGGERLYRTGDLARYVRGGGIEYVGRRDEQVKVRGHRIELGEIESVLREQAGVSEAVVVVQGEREEERRLVAYVVSGNGPEVGSRELREQLRQRLPEYLVPAVIVALAELPLTANGKIDRRALPEPEGNEGRSVESRWEGPRTAVEELLCGIWSEVLRVTEVGIRENFFELGGHSLLATLLVSRIREAFGVEVPLRSVFEAPTVEELAPLLVQSLIELEGSEHLSELIEELETNP